MLSCCDNARPRGVKFGVDEVCLNKPMLGPFKWAFVFTQYQLQVLFRRSSNRVLELRVKLARGYSEIVPRGSWMKGLRDKYLF